MLQKLNNFDELCLTFKWNIPEFYNIASDTVDQDIYQNRIPLINFFAPLFTILILYTAHFKY